MSSSASSKSQPEAGAHFLAVVRDFCHLIYSLDKPNEMKAAAFIFECGLYKNEDEQWELEEHKKITLDEFVNGRKLKNGERFTPGCNISDRGNASKALDGLEAKGKASIRTDNRDGARRKNFYRLTLPSLYCCQSNNIENQDTAILPINVVDVTTFQSKRDSNPRLTVVKTTTQSCQSNNTVLLNQQLDQSKDLEKGLRERTFNAPAIESPLETVAPDGAVASTVEDVLTLREKEEDVPESLFPELSHSPARPNASGRGGLHETLSQEDERITYTRGQVLKYQKDLAIEEEYLGTCELAARPAVEIRVSQLRNALTVLEQDLLDLRPAPPLDDSNWQQQLFAALCKVAGINTERITKTPMAGSFGEAAKILQQHKRRPEDVPNMWHRFRNDPQWRWMNGKGDMGRLMIQFARNGAVL